MAKYAKTDSGAFNSIRFGKIDWKAESKKAKEAAEKMRAENIAALKAIIEADTKKLKKAASRTAAPEKPQFSGAPEFLESRMKAGAL